MTPSAPVCQYNGDGPRNCWVKTAPRGNIENCKWLPGHVEHGGDYYPKGSCYQATSAPVCEGVKVYDTSWKPLTENDLSSLKVGDKVRFAVSGKPENDIDKAKFTITTDLGTTQSVEVTQKRPNSNEFYFEYTIPSQVKRFRITGQVHSKELGWF